MNLLIRNENKVDNIGVQNSRFFPTPISENTVNGTLVGKDDQRRCVLTTSCLAEKDDKNKPISGWS